jgi:formylglycine-generating enzyme
MKPSRSNSKGKPDNKPVGIAVWIPVVSTIIGTLGTIAVAYFGYLGGGKQRSVPEIPLTVTIQPSATPQPVPVSTLILSRCPDGMVYIPEGSFIFGAAQDDEDASEDEILFRKIYLDAFCIDRTEVSNEAYAKFVPSWTVNNLPVVDVTWYEANAYCQSLGRELPTEYQWEKAARGETGNKYPWGDEGGQEALKKANVGNLNYQLSPVDSYEDGASPYGVLNMAGNASEWTADWYDSDWYSQLPIDIGKNPTGPAKPGEKNTMVVRGGDLGETWKNVRTTARFGGIPPDESADFLGFRCISLPQ